MVLASLLSSIYVVLQLFRPAAGCGGREKRFDEVSPAVPHVDGHTWPRPTADRRRPFPARMAGNILPVPAVNGTVDGDRRIVMMLPATGSKAVLI